ncbi:transcription factor Iwr1 [Purpureocillium lilacinum]|uniref:Transcription factor Iwr1 n=1 Tax=Purpureocillium lilacinum TaxID=33203 RepID=A0A179HGD1_PURLI|nr:transcription factor Iwr1 [Purpureocillium lilacinum]OAQ89084.1 transcription factor Iwr1 [Purpureocillium lilacinum]
MSIPPQLIRVKRKRVEEAPVQFLQFDASQKRHRSGTWAYQRREPTAEPVRADKPVIHVSRPEDASPPTKKHQGVRHSLDSTVAGQSASGEAVAGHSPGQPALAEPRRFRVSRSATLSAGKSQVQNAGVSKRDRYAPAVFVEGTRRKKLARKSLAVLHETAAQPVTAPPSTDGPTGDVQQKDLKRPGVKKKATADSQKDGPTHRPLPESIRNRQHGNMDKIAADMDRWVLDEIGANLHGMEQDKQLAQKPRFKPKAPAKRFHERHPEFAQTSHTQVGESTDVTMTDASDDDAEEDDDDWVIEEYVRVPALTISMDVPATDIGVLDLADDEDSALLFGPLPEDDDDADEEDEDENAENHYTADYPEDEVDSDDEFGRHAYLYRNTNASDEEEFDNAHYSDGDDDDDEDIRLKGNDDDDDDVRMARIRAYMKRHSAFP